MSEDGAGDGDRWQHLAPIHSWKATATIVLVLVPLMAIGALMYRGRTSASIPNLKPPKGASDATLPPPTTLPPSLAGLPLPAADGTPTTPTVRLQGVATVGGLVSGPSGGLPGAIVHIDRIEGGYSNDYTTAGDARYLFQGMPGGRYRLRAYFPPSYAQTESTVLFVSATDTLVQDLTVEQFDPLAVTAAVAPDPPTVGTPFNLVIRVAKRTVDADGVVRSTPVPGATMTIYSNGTLYATAAAGTTGADGTLTVLSACKAVGPLSTSVQVKLTPADAPQTATLDLPACVAAPTTTTAPVASSTVLPTTTAQPN